MDKKHKKKLKRKAKKKQEQARSTADQQKLKNQMNMFDRMPKACDTCGEDFPATREAHTSWRVVVRNEEQQVRLFCPICLEKASKLVEEQSAAEQEAKETPSEH